MRQNFVLSRDLLGVRNKISSSQFVLPGKDKEAFDELQENIITQLDDYILPSLADAEKPTVVVVAGSTGAGKSMLVNSLVQEQISASGVLRPTTKQPVLLTNEHDVEFATEHKLGRLCKVTVRDEIAAGLVIIDAPDVDSISRQNREMAAELLRNADVWLFVTTARRYADQVPWNILKDGLKRDVPLGIVANRIPQADAEEIIADIERSLEHEGLSETELYTVMEHPGVELLPPEDVAAINDWLTGIIQEKTRELIRRQALAAQLQQLRSNIEGLIDLLASQGIRANSLAESYEATLRIAGEKITELIDRDSALSAQLGELWLTHVQRENKLEYLSKPVGRIRAWRGRKASQQALLEDVGARLFDLVKNRVSDTLWQAFSPLADEVHALETLEDAPAEATPPAEQLADGRVVDQWKQEIYAQLSTYMNTADADRAKHMQRVRKITSPSDLVTLLAYASFGQIQALALCEHLLPGSEQQILPALRSALEESSLGALREACTTVDRISADEDARGMAAAKLRLSMLMLKDIG